ncbi:MAG: Wzz/FepE/Etk N-terminal domain-containing protein [Gemmatimonadaceae bacterium]
MRPFAVAGGDASSLEQDRPVEVSVYALGRVILSHRRLVLGTGLAALLLAIAFTMLVPQQYSSATAFVPQSRSVPSNISGLAAQFGVTVPTGDGTQSPQFYADLLLSRDILSAVASTTYSVPSAGGTRTGTLVDFYQVDEKNVPLARDKAMRKLRDDVAVSISPKTGVVTVTVTARTPALARMIAQRLLELTNEFNLKRRRSQAVAERQFTESRLAEVRSDLRAAENRLESFLQQNRQYETSPALRFDEGRLQRDVTLEQQLFTTLAQAYEQAKIDEVRDTPVITVISAPDNPIRPDPRGIVKRSAAALIGGIIIGVLLAFWREARAKAVSSPLKRNSRFAALGRDALDDPTQP